MKHWSWRQWIAASYLTCVVAYLVCALTVTVSREIDTAAISKHKQCVKATQEAALASTPLPWCVGVLP